LTSHIIIDLCTLQRNEDENLNHDYVLVWVVVHSCMKQKCHGDDDIDACHSAQDPDDVYSRWDAMDGEDSLEEAYGSANLSMQSSAMVDADHNSNGAYKYSGWWGRWFSGSNF
jgi:hypothetical protein